MTPFVPRPVLTYVVGVVGHRPQKLAKDANVKQRLSDAFAAIDAACLKEFNDAGGVYASNAGDDATKEPYRVRLLTGFAEGTDQLAAEAAPPAWGVEAILSAPQEAYEIAFAPENSSDGTDRRDEFRCALKRAKHRVVELPERLVRPPRGKTAPTTKEIKAARQAGFGRQGAFLVRQIDLLIVVWDGEDPEHHGDAADVVVRALERGVPVLWFSSNEDRAPWLLQRPEDVERETEAPDALGGALQDAIARALRPPALVDAKSAERPARARLDTFFVERSRRFCWWTAYDCLKRGWRIWTWRVRIPLEDRDAVLKSWKPFLERAPEGGGFRERLESVLLPRYHAAGQVATYYSHAYRSAYALAYFLATFAVFVSLFGTLPFIPHDPPESLTVKAILVVIELAVIGAIIAIVGEGRRRDWHGRWLDARALAERLRHRRFLALIGECDVARDDGAASSTGAAWTSWYLRATIRELGLPFGRLDAAFQRNALLAARAFELEEQLNFNKSNHRTLTHLNHRLHFWGDFCFFATAGVLVLFLVGWASNIALPTPAGALRGACGANGELACSLDHLKAYVVLLVALLPAMGAATAGVRFTGDFEEFAERSQETAERLSRLATDYDRAVDRVEFELTADTLAETARIMAEDLSDWRSLYARKKLSLPS
jgi:hypothetical protein